MLLSLIKTLLNEKSGKRFLLVAVLGLGFSLSVILAAMGLMDNYIITLRSVLKKSTGDILISSSLSDFYIDENMKKIFKKHEIRVYSSYLQIESFVISKKISKGILLKGVDIESYNDLTDLKLNFDDSEIAVGQQLAIELQVQLGDEVSIIFHKKNMITSPYIVRKKIVQIVKHGLYQKDLRFVYVTKASLEKILNDKQHINIVGINIPVTDGEHVREVGVFLEKLKHDLDVDKQLHPFWQGFEGLMRAVKIEKIMIGFLLQLIVIVSIFNVSAVILFFNEKKSGEIFLLRAVGLTQKTLNKIWFCILMGIWVSSCLISWIFVMFFDLCLNTFRLFKLPYDIYHIDHLYLFPQTIDFVFVFSLAFVWILIMFCIIIGRMKRFSLLTGLRKEFM